MITIQQEGNNLSVKIETGISVHSQINATRDCGTPLYAKLLADKLNEDFRNTIELIRKLEYNKGYEDHKKKKPKKQYFYTSLRKDQ